MDLGSAISALPVITCVEIHFYYRITQTKKYQTSHFSTEVGSKYFFSLFLLDSLLFAHKNMFQRGIVSALRESASMGALVYTGRASVHIDMHTARGIPLKREDRNLNRGMPGDNIFRSGALRDGSLFSEVRFLRRFNPNTKLVLLY